MRAGVRLATLEKLAAADAFRSVPAKPSSAETGLDRRQALWEVSALANVPPLPLFSWSATRETGEEPAVALPEMALSEHVVNDYQTLRLSLKAHPMSFLRDRLNAPSPPDASSSGERAFASAPGDPAQEPSKSRDSAPSAHFMPDPRLARTERPSLDEDDGRERARARRAGRILACAELKALPDGAVVRVAGVVLVRQRPGSAKGVVFMTLEDETGVANAVVWPNTLEKFRKVVMAARLVLITGRIQRHEDIIHVVSSRLEDKSAWLDLLAEGAAGMKISIATADEVPRAADAAPDRSTTHPRWAGHPRNERPISPRGPHILPKSRDFR